MMIKLPNSELIELITAQLETLGYPVYQFVPTRRASGGKYSFPFISITGSQMTNDRYTKTMQLTMHTVDLEIWARGRSQLELQELIKEVSECLLESYDFETTSEFRLQTPRLLSALTIPEETVGIQRATVTFEFAVTIKRKN